MKGIGLHMSTLQQFAQEERGGDAVDLYKESIATLHKALAESVSIAKAHHSNTKMVTVRDRFQKHLKEGPIEPLREACWK